MMSRDCSLASDLVKAERVGVAAEFIKEASNADFQHSKCMIKNSWRPDLK